jgi:hypothetical protein
MHEITEDLIERYVGFPETLDEEQHKLIEARIVADSRCRRIAKFYRAYYAELRSPENGPLTDSNPERNP